MSPANRSERILKVGKERPALSALVGCGSLAGIKIPGQQGKVSKT